MIEICRDHSRNVKRWRDGTMALRWCAAGMLEAGHQFRRVNGHMHLPKLRAALNRSTATSLRMSVAHATIGNRRQPDGYWDRHRSSTELGTTSVLTADRPVGRLGGQGACGEVCPLPGVALLGGVHHAAAHGAVRPDPGHDDPHPAHAVPGGAVQAMQRLDAALSGASSVPCRQVTTLGADAPGAAYAVTQQGAVSGAPSTCYPDSASRRCLSPFQILRSCRRPMLATTGPRNLRTPCA
jgi:hypothetical protein